MGNVPISCCRSKSPRSQHGRGGHRNAGNQHQSYNRDRKSKQGDDQESRHSPSHILQHISEREPDDSDTDPSSNALNRPIFASRSLTANKNKTSIYNDSYNSSISRQPNTPLTSSQDQGYNSNTSTNLTQYDGNLNSSFGSSIQHQLGNQNKSVTPIDRTIECNRLLLSNSPASSGDNNAPLSQVKNIPIGDVLYVGNFRKSSSCSTIFIDGSTISQPDLKQTIKCVSLAIYYHIENRSSESFVEIFDETIHPLKMPVSVEEGQPDELTSNDRSDIDRELNEPDYKAIYWFVKTLFSAAQLTSEYAITTLVYLERLMTYAEMDLTPRTWRRIFLGAILLSSKVWEDQAVWNVDYALILEGISVEDINELERQFLELIQFNMNIPSSVYAKYYFHLRTLALKHGISQQQTVLTVGEAKTLEAMSRVQVTDWHCSPIQRKAAPSIKRHTSLEKLRQNGFARAVLM